MRVFSALLLSIASLGLLVAEANAQNVQQAVYFYSGNVRLRSGFSGAVQYAEVWMSIDAGFISLQTEGWYWRRSLTCIPPSFIMAGGSVSASCSSSNGYLKFWTKGLYPGSPATLQFYLRYGRYGMWGQWIGTLTAVTG